MAALLSRPVVIRPGIEEAIAALRSRKATLVPCRPPPRQRRIEEQETETEALLPESGTVPSREERTEETEDVCSPERGPLQQLPQEQQGDCDGDGGETPRGDISENVPKFDDEDNGVPMGVNVDTGTQYTETDYNAVNHINRSVSERLNGLLNRVKHGEWSWISKRPQHISRRIPAALQTKDDRSALRRGANGDDLQGHHQSDTKLHLLPTVQLLGDTNEIGSKEYREFESRATSEGSDQVLDVDTDELWPQGLSPHKRLDYRGATRSIPKYRMRAPRHDEEVVALSPRFGSPCSTSTKSSNTSDSADDMQPAGVGFESSFRMRRGVVKIQHPQSGAAIRTKVSLQSQSQHCADDIDWNPNDDYVADGWEEAEQAPYISEIFNQDYGNEFRNDPVVCRDLQKSESPEVSLFDHLTSAMGLSAMSNRRDEVNVNTMSTTSLLQQMKKIQHGKPEQSADRVVSRDGHAIREEGDCRRTSPPPPSPPRPRPDSNSLQATRQHSLLQAAVCKADEQIRSSLECDDSE